MKTQTLILIGGGIALACLAKRSTSSSLEGLGDLGTKMSPGPPAYAREDWANAMNMTVGAAVVTSYNKNGFNIYSTNSAGPWLVRKIILTSGKGVTKTAYETIGSYATSAEADEAANKMTPEPSPFISQALQNAVTTITPNTYPSSAPINTSYQPSASMPVPQSKAPLIAAGAAAIAVPLLAFFALR